MKKKLTDKESAIKEWKDKGVKEAYMEFSCGGDSMNGHELFFFDKEGKPIEMDSETYFEDDIFNSISFYVNSDGHYIGEAGQVRIELDEESEDKEEHDFQYSKDAEAEFSENHTEVGELKLTKEECEFIKNYVRSIVGESPNCVINFKKDFILTDELDKVCEGLKENILSAVEGFEFSEISEWDNQYIRFTTLIDKENNREPIVDKNILMIEMDVNYTVYRDSAD